MTCERFTRLVHTAYAVVPLLFVACSPQRSDGGEAVDVTSGQSLASADTLASRDDRLFLPRRIHHTDGNVANPEGLLPVGAGTTTLTAAAGEREPMIVLDYGRDVGGVPEFLITAVTGAPRLQAIYSESLDDLLPFGDASYPAGHEVNVSYIGNAGGASLSRVNSFTVTGPGLVRTAMAQGGERYQAIRITGAGTVTLARVGVRSTHTTVHATRRGSFLSSDPALNEIWELGAATVELTSFPAETLPTTWTIDRDGLRVSGSSYSVYQAGTAWHDYTASFDLHVVSNEASWFVGEPVFGFQFTVAARDDRLAAPNTIRVTSPFAPGNYAQASLPFALEPGTWHRIRVVNSSAMRVFIDDTQVLEFIAWPGSFGFAGYDDAVGLFRNLRIVDATGATLYASALTGQIDLDAFAAGSNRLPVMIDGAKRDRWIWAGDLAVAGSAAFYATGDAAALAGSLTLLGSYQRTDGLVPGTAPPQLVPGLAASGDAMPGVYFYSLSYSMYFVIALYDDYLHTGDMAFLRWAWPIATRDLAYAARRVDRRHLVITDDANQKDWHPHDAARLTGAVTEFNVIYYRALIGAAAMARALGERDAAATYQQDAAQLRTAIHTTLFDEHTGLYAISDSAELAGLVAQDANAMAVLYGVAPRDRRRRILDAMAAVLATPNGPMAFSPGAAALSQIISPFVSSFEVAARFEAGDVTGALDLIRTVWEPMRNGRRFSTGTVWEALSPDGMPATAASADGTHQSLAHGWGSGPTSALSKYVLGVRPVEAGYASWLIEPAPGDLAWATGHVPTPSGVIDVRWWIEPCRIQLAFSVPTGTTASVGLPAAAGRSALRINGRVVTAQRGADDDPVTSRPDYLYVRGLGPGRYQVATAVSASRWSISPPLASCMTR